MKKKIKQSELQYDKNSEHLPMFGVGPIYVFSIAIMTIIAVILDRAGLLPNVRPAWGVLLFIVLGAALILSGAALWIKAVLMDKVDKNIEENRLLTSGAYAIVRNPIYTAFNLLCSGALLINGNVLTFFLPFVYWLFMTVLMKNTEEKWLRERYAANMKHIAAESTAVYRVFPKKICCMKLKFPTRGGLRMISPAISGGLPTLPV